MHGTEGWLLGPDRIPARPNEHVLDPRTAIGLCRLVLLIPQEIEDHVKAAAGVKLDPQLGRERHAGVDDLPGLLARRTGLAGAEAQVLSRGFEADDVVTLGAGDYDFAGLRV